MAKKTAKTKKVEVEPKKTPAKVKVAPKKTVSKCTCKEKACCKG